MKIIATRRSVCAGDDCDAPHEKSFIIETYQDLHSFTKQILANYSLLYISGDKATWIFYIKNIAVAIIAQQWKEPKIIVSENIWQNIAADPLPVYFDYLCQQDPELFYPKN